MSSGSAPSPAALARLRQACNGLDVGICAGIDPSPATCALLTGHGTAHDLHRSNHATTARADMMRSVGLAIVEGAAEGGAAAVKPQMAWFEQAGAAGLDALAQVTEAAHAHGLYVVLDGKRGDIPHSAAAYAAAYLGSDAASGIRGDALTAHAWAGEDALHAMCSVAHERDSIIYVVLLMSNPGAAQLSDLVDTTGTPVWTHVARWISSCGAGAVVGATRPELAIAAGAMLPDTPLLIPGVGAQGGTLAPLAPLIRSRAAPALITASRSLLPPEPQPAAALTASVASHVAELRTITLDAAS
jgi:orotidine 5'-phosphate decarboxylase subfamily 2